MLFRQLFLIIANFCLLAWLPSAVAAQSSSQNPIVRPQRSANFPSNLPTDRSLRAEYGIPLEQAIPTAFPDEPQKSQIPPVDLKSLMRPRIDISAEWQPESSRVAIGSYDLSVKTPLYPILGPPPPFVTSGYSFTQINAPDALDLPDSLHEFTLGLAWMRRINDKWMTRFMLNGAFASDLDNTSSDAWQIRGGGFALYRPNDQWSFAFGALATGRDDLPVLPAIGAIWEPSPDLTINLMLPQPKISYLMADDGTRQHWGYFGGGISGGNWAYERASGIAERLNYREWRLLLGWESKPRQTPGTFRPTGKRFNAEIGYVLGREFEFDSGVPGISIDDALLLRTRVSF